jgi:hypothetical protein
MPKITQFAAIFQKECFDYDKDSLDKFASFERLWESLDTDNRARYLKLARSYDGISDLS